MYTFIVFDIVKLQVTTLGRRESTVQNDKLDHRIVDFENLPDETFNDQDVAICTLGNYITVTAV
jgi:hypothetical protein